MFYLYIFGVNYFWYHASMECLVCFRLQKFKLNIANTVISQENSSLGSMGTDQLLDLFTLDSTSKGHQVAKSSQENLQSEQGGKVSFKAMLENFGELWDEKQYETEYNLDTFMSSLKK